MKNIKAGFALCGSFCTFDKALEAMENLSGEMESVQPIMSERAATTDTRFGKTEDFMQRIEKICGKAVLKTIAEVEPLGPQGMLDVLIVAPCTGNTLAKIAGGITDTSVTMACKSHLRNGKPVVIALSTNDGLSGSAANIGKLLNRKNIYFVPFYQDDPEKKPSSLTADLSRLRETVEAAMNGEQLQPILLQR